MATVTGLTAERMLAIEAASVVDGTIDVSGHLILTTHGGTDIDAGSISGAASDTVSGIVELATNAETATGTDATRAVTPAGLASLVASATAKGIVELATNTEVATGTDTVRAVTPAGLASLAASDTAKGIVELATNTEVATGTDAFRAVTPAGLASLIASATASGIVELATNAETATGTDAVRAVTPAGLKSVTDTINSDIALKVPTTRQVIAGTGLTGGGALSADRTLTVAYGVSSTTAAVGNDARLSDSRTPTAHAASHASAGSDPVTIAESQVTNLTTDLATKAPIASPTFTGTVTTPRIIVPPVVLTPGTTVAVNAALGNAFRLTPAQNFTLSNPTNSTDGQMIIFEIIQDGTGSRVMTLGTDFAFGSDITAAVLSTGANKVDYLGVRYNSTAAKWRVIAFVKGY